jgi:hypothetical protein
MDKATYIQILSREDNVKLRIILIANMMHKNSL